MTLNDGMLFWLEYLVEEKSSRIVIKLDKRAKVSAMDIKLLPRGPANRAIADVCRSTYDEINEENYKYVPVFCFSVKFQLVLF